jgi:hypothetical protein
MIEPQHLWMVIGGVIVIVLVFLAIGDVMAWMDSRRVDETPDLDQERDDFGPGSPRRRA